MKKYYNKELPDKVHVIYGGRRAGVTYREFEKLNNQIKELKEENKKLKEEHKELVETNYDLAEKLKSQKEGNKILKKVEEYIEKQLKDTKQCLEYNREQHNLPEVEKYTRDYNLYTNILERL